MNIMDMGMTFKYILEKSRVLIWLLLHQFLLVNSYRLKCGLTTSPLCSRCSGGEDVFHMLRGCAHMLESEFKMKMDGSCNPNASGMGFVGFPRKGDAVHVELLAILNRLKLAWEWNMRRFTIESDAMKVMEVVNHGAIPTIFIHLDILLQV
ncbi:hypothetical protein RJT34_30347 [Clitoria ternatea]|uniref:RNase H type-1 domain-containing protein n=1 Tax=Clitoria ternatea TaxID=43366 RepID=A0AAN9ESK9_CLITE